MPPNPTPNITPNITPGIVPPAAPPPPPPATPTVGGPFISPQLPPQPQISPMQPMQLNPAYTGNGIPIASLILGIISLPASLLTIFTIAIPIVGLVLGAIGVKKNKGLSIAGIVLSAIGIILSVGIIVFGIHTFNKAKTASNSSLSSSATLTGNSISTACYSYDLPSPFSKSDQKKNQDCQTEYLNTSGAGDLVVNALPVSQSIPTAQRATFVRDQVNQLESSLGSEFTETSNKTVTIGGQQAYEASGTEQGTGTPYKYGNFMAVLAPKAYSSASGDQLQLFIYATDSVSQVSWLDHVAATWQWQ